MEEKGKNGVNMKQQTNIGEQSSGVGGGTQLMFIRGGSAPRSIPLPFYIPFFSKKVPLDVHFIDEDDFINMHTNAPAVLVFDYNYCFNKRKLLIL